MITTDCPDRKPIGCVCGHSENLHDYDIENGCAPCAEHECFCGDYLDCDLAGEI